MRSRFQNLPLRGHCILLLSTLIMILMGFLLHPAALYSDDLFSTVDQPVSAFPDSSGMIDESEPHGWIMPDREGLFPELQLLDDLSSETSMEYVNEARRFYGQSVAIMEQAEQEIEARMEEYDQALPGNRAWEIQEREDRKRRERNRILSRNRTDALSLIVRGLRTLEQVRNPAVLESDPFIDLKSTLIRRYVRLQFENGNYARCISVLDAYLELRESHKEEPEPYRLLAVSYRQQELMAGNARDPDMERYFEGKKNGYLLKYVELMYGKDSIQYRTLQERLSRSPVEVIS